MSDTFQETRVKIPTFSPSRIWTIATGTVTQLVRMKTLYFVLGFAVLVVAIGNINIENSSPVRQLELIKKVSFGTMDLFAWLFAIVATALLIPRDLEDRTLYTILSKPVRRIEYLVGKLFGVLILVGIVLSAMFIFCMIMLFIRQVGFIAEQVAIMQSHDEPDSVIAEQVGLIRDQGVQPALFVAAFASFLKAAVVSAMAIMISTFASSSLFTIISSILFFLIGHAHGMMRDYWLYKTDGNFVTKIIANLLKILVPDYQLFAFSEGIVLGSPVVGALVSNMCLITVGYLFVFLLISHIIFMYKEF